MSKSISWQGFILCCALFSFMSIGCHSRVGGESAKSDKLTFERMSRLVEAYRNIGQILDLTPEQKQTFKEIFAEHKKRFEAFYDVDGKELVGYQVEAMNSIRNFRRFKFTGVPKNEQKTKRIAELNQQERTLQSNFEKDLLSAVPQDKLQRWKCYRISELVLEFFDPLELDNGQREKVRKLAPRALAMLRRKQQSNWQGYGASKLESLASKSVLNSVQRQSCEKLKFRKLAHASRWNNPSM